MKPKPAPIMKPLRARNDMQYLDLLFKATVLRLLIVLVRGVLGNMYSTQTDKVVLRAGDLARLLEDTIDLPHP